MPHFPQQQPKILAALEAGPSPALTSTKRARLNLPEELTFDKSSTQLQIDFRQKYSRSGLSKEMKETSMALIPGNGENLGFHCKIMPMGCSFVSCRVRNCGVRLPKSELHEHIETAHPKKKFQCDVCPMSFKVNRDLIQHQRTHSGIKPFKCEVCGKKFTQKCTLKKHQEVHIRHGDRSFKCEVCGKTFTQKGHMKRHMMLHTGEKPFSCCYCGVTFNRADSRNFHEVKCSEKYK